MEKKNRKPKLSTSEFEQSVLRFFESQQKFKRVQTHFNELKAKFNSEMKDFFECKGISRISVKNFVDGTLVVNRVQKTSVEFDAQKLEKVLDKNIVNQVVVKRYEIIDMSGLIAYLKECNVDPKIFKTFLNISKTVDIQELDRLEELGKITAKQVEGCYTIKHQNPYFTVGVKKGQNDEEQKW